MSRERDILAAMPSVERRAHRLLAAELAIPDETLSRLIARARSADAFLCGRPGGSVAPATEERGANVIDPTAYRIERAQRAAMDGL